jgi:hypothetical protein
MYFKFLTDITLFKGIYFYIMENSHSFFCFGLAINQNIQTSVNIRLNLGRKGILVAKLSIYSK